MAEKAVLLLNLGSPDSASVPDVRRYLREFLSDERVIDTSPFLRALLLNLFILPFRPKASAHAYSRIWTPEGSPLMAVSRKQRALLQEKTAVPVALAMRYGNPSIPGVIAQLAAGGVENLFIMPLYPHYAMSSYETVAVRVMDEIAAQKPGMRATLLQPFYDDPVYIDALVQNARPHLREGCDLLLFSFHGIPERHLRKSDPSRAYCLATAGCCNRAHPAHATCYRRQCFRTVEKFVESAGIPAEKYAVSFQSRLGRDPWLKPYTDFELKRFAAEGVKKILVICPSFVADCLETLEEIALRGRESFIEAGGESLKLIPCLNEHPAFIRFLTGKVERWLAETG